MTLCMRAISGAVGLWRVGGEGVVRVLFQFLYLPKDRNPCCVHFFGILLITTVTNVKTVRGGAKIAHNLSI